MKYKQLNFTHRIKKIEQQHKKPTKTKVNWDLERQEKIHPKLNVFVCQCQECRDKSRIDI